jgi:hypothetical protein
MALRGKIKWGVIVLALIVVGLQFTTPAHTNPPVDNRQTLAATMTVPPEVSAAFTRSCNDCHSDTTNWRWYTYVAPVSWFTVGHVNEGRRELNLSEWGGYSKRKQETRLKGICAQVRSGDMPLASYALVHREVKLTPDEINMICAWSENARKQLEATAPSP